MSISAMNNTIKNNLKLLKNRSRDRFVHIPGNLGKVKKERYDHIILKPEVLKEIKQRLQLERRRKFKRLLIVFLIILVSLIGLLLL